MNLTKYAKGALIGAVLSASSNYACGADTTNVVLGVRNSSPTVAERSISDISSVMTVNSKDTLKADKLSLEGKFTGNIEDKFVINLEDKLIRQRGDLNRDSLAFNVIEVSEDGNYSKLRNTLRILFGTESARIGFNYLKEKEKRDYTQHTEYMNNKINTGQDLQIFGPVIRVPFNHQGRINLAFNTDFTYFLDGIEKYRLALEDKSLPGDSEFERKRKVKSLLSETSIEIGVPMDGELLRELGVKANMDYLSKEVRQNSTTERYMPVYENYNDARLHYALETFVRVGNIVFNLGVEQEHHRLKGSLETKNDNQNRVYGGAEIRLNFK